ncbi:MAG: hypothetical protein H6641_09890 [Caldilineaceae bacterium]|nr:hypothetical protein [Caldilineaceae bacterium]
MNTKGNAKGNAKWWKLVVLLAFLLVGCSSRTHTRSPQIVSQFLAPFSSAKSDAEQKLKDELANAAAANGSRASIPALAPLASRGYLTTPQELAEIRQKADDGVEPYASAMQFVLKAADRKWEYELDEQQTCKGADRPAWLDEGKGIPRLYARALAYHLTGDTRYAQEVKSILQRIMTEVVQVDLDEQQCRLNFGWGTPELVAAADLIEAYWAEDTCTGPTGTLYSDVSIGSGNCKALFQNWLVKNPYYVVSFTAEDAMGNWGAAATNTLAYIADYLWDRPELEITHRMPYGSGSDSYFELSLHPHDAYVHANQIMFDRMNGYGVDLHSSSSCDYLDGSQQDDRWAPVKSQITENGVIPEDARREEKCNIPEYDGSYQNYPQVHLGNNIQQCELMWRRGDSSCYDNVATDDLPNYVFSGTGGGEHTTHLYPGRGSIERAIKAIIVDADTEWKHDSALAVAIRYYYEHHTLPGFGQWRSHVERLEDCDQDICFGALTHGLAPDEAPVPPPLAPPP